MWAYQHTTTKDTFLELIYIYKAKKLVNVTDQLLDQDSTSLSVKPCSFHFFNVISYEASVQNIAGSLHY